MWIDTRNFVCVLTVAAVLWGCGSGEGTAGSAAHPVARKASKPIDAWSANMVAAVADPKGLALPVQVKFVLKERPNVGQPLDIEIGILPVSGSVDRLSATIEGDDGLDVLSGNQIAPIDRPPEGVLIHQTVKVMPKHDGIFTLSTRLTLDSAGQSLVQTYSLPVITDARASAPGATPDTRAGSAKQ